MAEEKPFDEATSTPKGLPDVVGIYADATFCSYWTGHIRISFAERFDGEPIWRSAVVLEADVARGLIETLQECLAILDKRGQGADDHPSETAKEK